jgi:DNA-directed RNA polymerase alpha subunit
MNLICMSWLLSNYLVGTAKSKSHQQPRDYSKLVSLREQDLSSIRTLAKKNLEKIVKMMRSNWMNNKRKQQQL